MTFASYSTFPPFTNCHSERESTISIARYGAGDVWRLDAEHIATTQTGLPFNITITRSNGSVPGNLAVSGEERPNLVPGVSLTPPGGSTPGNG